MEKLIKKSSKQLIRKTKIGNLNDKNVLMKNNEKKNRKQLYEKLYKKKEKILKNNEINYEHLCKIG